MHELELSVVNLNWIKFSSVYIVCISIGFSFFLKFHKNSFASFPPRDPNNKNVECTL